MTYWPWWAVGTGLAATFVLAWWTQGRLLGVSGLLAALFDPQQRDRLKENLAFVLCLALGGLVASWWRGQWGITPTLGPDFQRLFGSNVLPPLFFGGVLIGLGTRTAGGCTSGHGLNGCARLQPASLLSTASFFGAGVVVSNLLEWWCR